MTNSEDLWIVAFQAAGRVGDTNGWVSDAVLRLQLSGAHVGGFTETRTQTTVRHSRIANAVKENGYTASSHYLYANHTESVGMADELARPR